MIGSTDIKFSSCAEMIAWYASFFIILVAFVYCYFKNIYCYWKNKNVIGPKPIPGFGNIKETALRQKHVGVLFQEIYNDFPNEKLVGIYRMISPTLVVRDLDIVKQILVKDFEAFPDRGFEFSKEGLGDNLFHCDPITWRALRGHMSPLFTPGKLKNNVNVLQVCSDKFVDHMKNVCLKNQEQEVTQLFLKYSASSIMACYFGIHFDSIYDNPAVFEEIDNSIFKLRYINEIDMIYPGILKKTNSSLFNEVVNRFCYEIVQTVKYYKNGEIPIMSDVMDILLSLEKQGEVKSIKRRDNEPEVSLKLTEHVLAAQVFVFFAAGTGNNTITLSHAMYHLAKNSEIQDKAYAEIKEVLERFNGEITYECIKEMTYLDKVFDETLRMHPTTNAIQRSVGKDYTFPGTDLKIEKGVSIVISPLAIHHDEKFYPNPEQFDPERFTLEAIRNRHSCAYLPFGAGPRSCLGIRFAKLQFKVCVVNLLSKFRVETSRRTKDKYDINPHRSLMCPMGGMYLNIIPRSP